jgi:uncharacterized damage-inducible protein DinB
MQALQETFRHHIWATQTLIDRCAGLRADELDATTPGTMGSIHDTLVHLVAADRRFLGWLGGVAFAQTVQEGDRLTMAELAERFVEHRPHWDDVVERADELDVTIPSRRGRPELPHAQNLLVAQAIHHGNDHRTHVCTVLSSIGIEPPTLDVWAYWFAMGKVPTGG